MTEDEMNRFIASLSLATPEPEFNVRNLPSAPSYRSLQPDTGMFVGGGGERDVSNEYRNFGISPGFRAGPVSGSATVSTGSDMPTPGVGYSVNAQLPGGFNAGYRRMHAMEAPSRYDQHMLSLAREVLGNNVSGSVTEQDGRRGFGAGVSRPLGGGGNAFINAQRDPRGGHAIMGGMDMRFSRGGYADGGDAEVQSNGMPVISDGQINWGDSSNAADFVRADQATRAMRSAPAAPEPQAAPMPMQRNAPAPAPYSAPRDVPLPPVRPANLGQPVFQNSSPEGPGAYNPDDGFPARPPGQYADPAMLFNPNMMAKGFTPPLEAPSAPPPASPPPPPPPGASDWRRGSFPQEGGGKYTNRAMPLTPPAQAEPLALLPTPTKAVASAAIDQAAPAQAALTRALPAMSPQQRDLIIRTIAAESSGKTPEEGQGIANVILNRIASGRYGKTPEKVLFAPKQFEPWADPRGLNYPMRHKPGTTKYEKAQDALEAAMGGDDITNGATLFWGPKSQAALGRPAPKWGRTGGLDIGETRFHREGGGPVYREHHANGDPVGDAEEYPDGARPLTIYRGVSPSVEPGPVDAPMQYPQASTANDGYVGPMDASVWGRSPTEPAPLFANEDFPASAMEQAAYKTPGEKFTSALGIENLPQGQTYASQGPTGIDRALQVIPNPANYLKRQGEAARENFDMMGQGVQDIRSGNYAAGALGLGGGALGYALSPITGAERVLFRDPYLNATGNLRDAEAVEMVADTALTGGLRGPAKMLLGKKSMGQLAAEPWRRMRMPSAATAVGAGAAGMTFAPNEAEAAKLPGGEAAARAIQAAKGVIAPQRQLSPLGLYSHGAETAAGLQQAKGTPEQYKAMLMKQGVRPVEFDASGFDTAFAGRPSVTRDEIAQHFSQSMPQVEERVLGSLSKMSDADFEKNYDSIFNRYVDNTGMEPRTDAVLRDWAEARQATRENEPKFQQYTLPGGENYREVLLKVPEKEPGYYNDFESWFKDNFKPSNPAAEAYSRQYAQEQWNAAQGKIPNYKSDGNYSSSHWDDPNVLAHIRMSDRTGPNGEKILHVEEVQSDWGQAGRKEGFNSPEDYARWKKADTDTRTAYQKALTEHRKLIDGLAQPIDEPFVAGRESPRAYERRMEALEEQRLDALRANPEFNASAERLLQARDARAAVGSPPSTEGVPKGPYVTSTQGWTDLAVKRILKEAAQGGYDKIVWTPGAEQAKRYNLNSVVDRIAYDPATQELQYVKSGNQHWSEHPTSVDPKELSGLIGKEAADALLSEPLTKGKHDLELENIEIGGKGMKSYYDQMLPKRFQELARKHDKSAQIGMTDVMLPPASGRGHNNPPIEAAGLTMTPQMRESILRGQHAYADGGGVIDRALNVINRR